MREAFDQVAHIIEKQEEIDALISKGSKGYDFNRISIVERNILRLGVFELFFEKKLPFKVVISEAIRLTRKFGTPDSAAFVNAVLETIHQNKNRTQKLSLSSI